MQSEKSVKTPMEHQEHIAIYQYDDVEEEEEDEEVVGVVEEEEEPDCSADSTFRAKSPVFGRSKTTWVPARAPGNSGDEVKNKMAKIGADLSNAVLEKKNRMELYIKAVAKDCDRNIRQYLKFHQDEMKDFRIGCTEKFIGLFHQWDIDVNQIGEQEDNLSGTFYQQQKTLRQSRVIQNRSLKELKQANEEFLKGLEDLENKNNRVLTSVRNEIKKQMTQLQKKITDG